MYTTLQEVREDLEDLIRTADRYEHSGSDGGFWYGRVMSILSAIPKPEEGE